MELENRHEIQMHILTKLQFSDGLRYSDMKPEGMFENNQFQYHVDRLLDEQMIAKEDSKYRLTTKGKTFANSIVSEEKKIHRYAKTSVRLTCFRGDDELEILIYRRLKHPFYGGEGVFAGKLNYGEPLTEGALRELKEETNLVGGADLFRIDRFIVKDKQTGQLLEDKFFYNFVVRNLKGELKGNDEGEYRWIKVKEIEQELKNPFEAIEDVVDLINEANNFVPGNNVSFVEVTQVTEKF